MSVEDRLLDNGYEDVIIFKDYDYADALIGVSSDNRAIYDFNLMVNYLIDKEGFKDETEAIEWIEYNTLRALPYAGDKGPIVMYRLEVT